MFHPNDANGKTEVAALVGYGLGIASGAAVLTTAGYLPIDALSTSNTVVDYFGRLHRILAIRLRTVSLTEGASADLFPVEFQVGSMGQRCPSASVRVSRGQSVLLRGISLQAHLCLDFAMARAEHLVNPCNIRIIDVSRVTYVQLLFATHVILMVNDLAVESGVVLEANCPFHRSTHPELDTTTDAKCGCGTIPRLVAEDVTAIYRSGHVIRPTASMLNRSTQTEASRRTNLPIRRQ